MFQNLGEGFPLVDIRLSPYDDDDDDDDNGDDDDDDDMVANPWLMTFS